MEKGQGTGVGTRGCKRDKGWGDGVPVRSARLRFGHRVGAGRKQPREQRPAPWRPAPPPHHSKSWMPTSSMLFLPIMYMSVVWCTHSWGGRSLLEGRLGGVWRSGARTAGGVWEGGGGGRGVFSGPVHAQLGWVGRCGEGKDGRPQPPKDPFNLSQNRPQKPPPPCRATATQSAGRPAPP